MKLTYRGKLKTTLEILDMISLHKETSISKIVLNCRISQVCLNPYLTKLTEKGILEEEKGKRKTSRFHSRTFRLTQKGKLAYEELKHCISILKEIGIEE